jgi:hypothetical protein
MDTDILLREPFAGLHPDRTATLMASCTRTSLSWSTTGAAHSSWLALLAVGGTFGCFAAAEALWPHDSVAALNGAPLMATAAPVAFAPARLRCDSCGVIEAIRRMEAAGGLPAAWVFSVRMRDGSLRHTSDPLPGRWQVGDSMQLIGGGR